MNRRSFLAGAVGLAAASALPMQSHAAPFVPPGDAEPWDIYAFGDDVYWMLSDNTWKAHSTSYLDIPGGMDTTTPLLIGNAQPYKGRL